MPLAGHSCCGKDRVGAQGRSRCSVQRERGRYTLYPAPTPAWDGTEAQHEEAQKEHLSPIIHLLGVLPELDGFGCFTRSGFSAAAPAGGGWAAVLAFLPCLDASGSEMWLLLMGGGNSYQSAKIKNSFSVSCWSRCGD